MKIMFKIGAHLLQNIREDLARPHAFAFERVGFIGAGLARADDGLKILATQYRPVADDEYIEDHSVGAMMGPEAIRHAMEWALFSGVALFHVHSHGGHGVPRFSGIDLKENKKFIPTFANVAPDRCHGAIVLSDDRAYGQVWLNPTKSSEEISMFQTVGSRLVTWTAYETA